MPQPSLIPDPLLKATIEHILQAPTGQRSFRDTAQIVGALQSLQQLPEPQPEAQPVTAPGEPVQ